MTASPTPSDSSRDDPGDEPGEATQTTAAAAAAAAKVAATKDKECQYCHQKFTSSSLGRHLDQFISKKKPDGIHNVEEIRRLRGGITRRTARQGTKTEQEDARSAPPSPSPQYTLPSYSELLNKTATDVRFNRANWQATGVITDPSSSNPPLAAPAAATVPSPAQQVPTTEKRSYSTFAADLSTPTTTSPASETVRALELSLREVLDAVRVATSLTTPQPRPFDFDLESQTFPFLCLALIPAPPTLFQSAPFATTGSLSLTAPGLDQYNTLRQNVSQQIDLWKWRRLTEIQRASAPGANIAEDMDAISSSVQAMQDRYGVHVDAAYHHFTSFPPDARHNLWTIELLRSFKTEQDRLAEAKAQIERLEVQTKHLQQQIDHLSTCQWPREMALWPPEKPSFDSGTREELRRLNLLRSTTASSTPVNGSIADSEAARGAFSDRWDYDALLSKWRQHVRNDRARRTGVQPSGLIHELRPQPLPGPAGPTTAAGGHDPNSPASNPNGTPRLACLGHSNTLLPDLTPSHPGAYGIHADGSPRGNAHNTLPRPVSGLGHGLDGKKRSINIVSDVEEHLGPRFAGLRK